MSPYFATFIDPRKTVIRQRHCRFDDHEIATITSYNSAFSRPNGPPVWAAAGWLDHESPDLWMRHGGLSSTALWAGAEWASGTTQRRASAADPLQVQRRAIISTRHGCGSCQEKHEARPPIAVGRAGARRLLRRGREGEMMARAAAAVTFCIEEGSDQWPTKE